MGLWKKSYGWLFHAFLERWFVIMLGLGAAVLLRVFRFKDHIYIPASGLQFVVVIFEIGVAFVLCGSSRKQLFFSARKFFIVGIVPFVELRFKN